MQPRTRKLNIYLAKEGVSISQLFRNREELSEFPVHTNQRRLGILHVKPSYSNLPRWFEFLSDSVDIEGVNIFNASSGAVLTIRCRGRLFALAFGTGWHYLDLARVEPHFGLRTTLNSVSSARIRVIDRKKLHAVSHDTREQASSEVDITEFGLDIEQDLLRGMTAPPEDTRLGVLLSGAISLSAQVKIRLDDLRILFTLYLAKFNEDGYKEHFPWVDNVREVRDPELREELDDLLVNQIQEGETEKIWLAVPEIIDWTEIEGFRYRTAQKAELHPDVFLEAYLAERGPATDLTIQQLRRDYIYAVESTGGIVIRKWSPYRCVNAEVQWEDETFCLSNGTWYQIEPTFLEIINSYYLSIPKDRLTLPDYDHEDEESYNREVAESEGLALMDRDTISYGGGRSRIEFCDLYTSDCRMVHVKRYHGAGSLSHLFNQGLVSASTFLYEEDFRKKLNPKLPPVFQLADPLQRPEARNYEIVYAVISSSDRPLDLPFFSRVSLRNVGLQLERLGYKFSLTKISSNLDDPIASRN